jgi:Probable Zinc-ribbon domain
VADWNAYNDPFGQGSIPALVSESDRRQLANQKRALVRAAALRKVRRVQEENERRIAQGLPPITFGGRRLAGSGRRRRSVRGKFVADFPDLMREWEWQLNYGLDPHKIRGSDRRRVWWVCHHDPDHVWQTRVEKRAGARTGCPFCAGQRTHPKESLAALDPDLAAQWHPTKNGDKTPDMFLPASGHRPHWLCPTCGHEWPAYIFSRAKDRAGCRACFRRELKERTKAGVDRAQAEKDAALATRLPDLVASKSDDVDELGELADVSPWTILDADELANPSDPF